MYTCILLSQTASRNQPFAITLLKQKNEDKVCLRFYYIKIRFLFRITHGTCFTDNRNLHLSRISHFVLNFLSDISR